MYSQYLPFIKSFFTCKNMWYLDRNLKKKRKYVKKYKETNGRTDF